MVSKNVYFDKLDETVNKYNKTYHGTLKMKLDKFKPGIYIEYGAGHNKKDPKFKVGDHVRISKSKNFSTKDYTEKLTEEVFLIQKIKKILYYGHKLLVITMVKRLLEHSMKKSCRRQAKKNSGLKKYSRKKVKDFISYGKAVTTYSIAGLI